MGIRLGKRVGATSLVSRAALIVVMSAVATRTVWMASSWFKDDDFVYRWRLVTSGLDLGYLFTRLDGHLMPGALAQAWIMDALFGASWWPIVVWSGILQLAAGWLSWRLYRSLLGDRAVVLVVLTALVWNPLMLDATMWWASAMQLLPLSVGFPAVLLLMQRAIRSGRTGDAVLVAVGLTLTLLFAEKAIFLVPFAAALTLAMPLAVGAGATVRDRARSARKPLLAMTLIGAAWAVVYLTAKSNIGPIPDATADQKRDAAWNLVIHVLVPSGIGGPWSWLRVGESGALAVPSSTAVWISGLAAVALVVWTVVRRPHVARLWGVLVLYIVCNVASLSAGRIGVFGPIAGLIPRYAADAVAPTMLVVGLAVLRNVTDVRTNIVREGIHLPNLLTGAAGASRAAPVAVVALIMSAVATSVRLVDIVSTAPGRAYVANALRGVSAADGPVELLSQPAPAEIVNGLFSPNNTTKVVLTPVSDRFIFVDAAERPHIVASDGRIVLVEVGGVVVERPDGGECLAQVKAGATEVVELPVAVFDWNWFATVTYRTEDPTLLVTSFDGATVAVPIEQPEGSYTFGLSGEGDRVEFGVLDGSLCIIEFRIGLLEEIAG